MNSRRFIDENTKFIEQYHGNSGRIVSTNPIPIEWLYFFTNSFELKTIAVFLIFPKNKVNG